MIHYIKWALVAYILILELLITMGSVILFTYGLGATLLGVIAPGKTPLVVMFGLISIVSVAFSKWFVPILLECLDPDT